MTYIADTSVIIERLISKLIKENKIKGSILIPRAALAELENQANTGRDSGLIGLEEIQELQQLSKQNKIQLKFIGERPNIYQIKEAKRGGEIDSYINDLAAQESAILITADKVQAESAKALDIEVMFIEKKIQERIELETFFDEKTMSVHLKEGTYPVAKKGKPGDWNLIRISEEILTQDRIERIAKEIIEKARIDPEAFIEISRQSSTIVQYHDYRIVIVKKPVADGWEITAVKPIIKLDINQYNIPEKIKERLEQKSSGVIISGQTGSGKCLSLDTPVYSNELGKIYLKDLLKKSEFNNTINYFNPKENITLLSLGKNGKITNSKIKGIKIRKENKLFNLKSRSGKEIKITEEHPFLIYRKEEGLKWLPLKEIILGDLIATPEKIEIKENNITFDLFNKMCPFTTYAYYEFKKKIPIYMLYNFQQPQRKISEYLFNHKINEFYRKELKAFSRGQLERGLNSLIKDGHLIKKKKNNFLLKHHKIYVDKLWVSFLDLNSFKINKEKIILLKSIGKNSKESLQINPIWESSNDLMKILAYLNSEGITKFGISNTSRIILSDFFEAMKNIFGIPRNQFKVNHDSYYIDNSGILREFFKKLLNYDFTLKRKSSKIKLPEFFMNLPKEQKTTYLRAYFDAEGYISKKEIELTSASKIKIQQLNNLLLTLGIHSRISSKLAKATNSPHPILREYYTLRISGSDNLRIFKEEINFNLDYKSNALSLAIKDKAICNVGAIPIQKILKELKKKLEINYQFNYNKHSKKQIKKLYPTLQEFYEKKIVNINSAYKMIHKLNYLGDWKTHMSLFKNTFEQEMKKNKRNFYIKYHFDGQCLNNWLNLKQEPFISTMIKMASTNLCFNLEPYSNLDSFNTNLKECYKNFDITQKDIAEESHRKYGSIGHNYKDCLTAKVSYFNSVAKVLAKKINNLKVAEVYLEDLKLLMASEIFWDEVDSIEPFKGEEVFDIELENNHNFIAGEMPFIVHNSTFAQALAEEYAKNNKITKTIESPRDLILSPAITQYSKNFGSSEEIHDILFLSRPDNVIFDEMRDTPDFKLFTDIRLGGSSVIGVLHAATPIDAVQRFISRLDVGIIPSVLDTIIFIDKGSISQVLTVKMTVKVPSGMIEADLARPVIEVKDLLTEKLMFEIYSYGEQTVVIPISKNTSSNPTSELAKKQIEKEFQKYSDNFEVEIISPHKVKIYVPDSDRARIIGTKGANIMKIEKELGIGIDLETLGTNTHEEKKRLGYHVTERGNSIILKIDSPGRMIDVYIEDDFLFTSTSGKKGEIKLNKKSDIGRKLRNAMDSNRKIYIKG